MLGKHRKSALNTVLGTAVCALIGLYSLTSSPVSIAQSSAGSEFDLSSTTEIKGEVFQTRFVGGTEATLVVVAADQTGARQEWTVVLGSSSELRERGTGLVFFAPGPGYTIAGHRSADPETHRLLATTVTRPDGVVWTR